MRSSDFEGTTGIYMPPLSESERIFMRLANNAKLGMMIVDESHRIIDANQRFADMLGYTCSEIKTLHTWDWDAVCSKKQIEAFEDFSKADFNVETKYRRKDGGVFDVEVSGVGIKLSDEPGGKAILCFCNDISERKNAEQLLIQSERKFKSFVENSADMILTVNEQGDVAYISPNCEKILGYSADDLLGGGLLERIDPVVSQSFLTDILAAFKGEYRSIYQYKIRHKDGSLEWYNIKLSLTEDAATGKPILICNTRNINDRIGNEDKLKYLSNHDQMTGLYNRFYFFDQFNLFDREKKYPLSVLCFDLDGLKQVNDSYGHTVGDNVLIRCVKIVETTLRTEDVFARMGGDEFAILLPRTSENEANSYAERIQQKIDEANRIEKPPLISISIGVSTLNVQDVSIKSIYKAADERMYQEKWLKKRARKLALKAK